LTANEYVAADGKQAVLFAFLHSQQFNTPTPSIRLNGLDPNGVYRLHIRGKSSTEELSGAYLESHGVDLTLKGDYDGAVVVIDRVN
jgi:alpha-galactosidase